MKLAFSAAVAALAIGSGAAAQTTISNPAGTVRNFDITALGPVLTELGVVWEQRAGPSGEPFIVADVAGLKLNILPAACLGPNNTQCVGGHAFALFESAPVNQQSINAFNLRYAFVSSGPIANGYYLSRYDIADFGIARGNVQSSLATFRSIAAAASQELSAGGQTVSTAGYADDLSAAILNEASALAIGLEPGAPAHVFADHAREVARAPELVKALAASGSAAFNKIENLPKQ